MPAQHENLRQAQYHANLDYDSAPLQLAQLNAAPATGVVFERPHLHNKTEITFPNFGLLQKRQRFQLKGENQLHLTCLFSASMELQKRKSSDDGGR